MAKKSTAPKSTTKIPEEIVTGIMNTPDGYCSICGKEIRPSEGKPHNIYEEELLCKVHFNCYVRG